MNSFDAMTESAEYNFPLDYYLQWEWPEHIETALRRLLWISLVELAEGSDAAPQSDHTSYIEWLIATNPDSPAEVLDHLSETCSRNVLVRIAENPQTCANTLSRLACCSDKEVRTAVSENSNTPPHVVMMLCRDESVDVRYAMAENASLPSSVLQELGNDENAYVAMRAKKTLVRRSSSPIRSIEPNNEQKRKLG